MKLFIRDEVAEDVEGIKQHIAADTVEAASRFGPAVLAAWDVLQAFSYIGRPRTFKLVAGVRSSWVSICNANFLLSSSSR